MYCRKAHDELIAKRKFAGVLMSDHNKKAAKKSSDNDNNKIQEILSDCLSSSGDVAQLTNSIITSGITQISNMTIVPSNVQQSSQISTGTPTVVSTILSESNTALISGDSPPVQSSISDGNTSTELTGIIQVGAVGGGDVSIQGDTNADGTPISKPEIKERKRRIRIDDDDESPTFNPLARGIRRSRGRGGRGSRGGNRGGTLRMQQRQQQRAAANALLGISSNSSGATPNSTAAGGNTMFLLHTPEKSRDGIIFTTPEGKVSGIFLFIYLFLFTLNIHCFMNVCCVHQQHIKPIIYIIFIAHKKVTQNLC